MINRQDAVNAREGMEQYKSGDMQLRVSVFLFFSLCILFLASADKSTRHVGVLVLDHVTAATTRPVSVSSQLRD